MKEINYKDMKFNPFNLIGGGMSVRLRRYW